MPRTFSLKWLLIGVTVVAVGCGLAVNFPELARTLGIVAAYFVPAVSIAGILSWRTAAPGVTFWSSIGAAAFCGLVAVVGMEILGTWRWESFLSHYLTIATPPAAAALYVSFLGVVSSPNKRQPPLGS